MYDKSNARIVYMGTPAISATVLQGLIDAGFHVVGLICNEDKPVGRKAVIEPTPTKKVALAAGIPVFQPHRIRVEHDFLKELNPDVIVTMAYGQIVPQEVLDAPKKGCINLHGSLLPKLRGAAPIQRSIMNGDKVTGVTLMEMVLAMDAGRMYDKVEVRIEESDNYTTLADKIGIAARDLIVADLLPYLNDELPGIPQEENEVTFASKILPEEEHLDIQMDARALLNKIRGLSATPGGYFYLEGKKLKIYSAHLDSEVSGVLPGTIVSAKKGLFVQAKDAVIAIDFLQLEGKKPMDAKSFVNGVHDLEGKVLE